MAGFGRCAACGGEGEVDEAGVCPACVSRYERADGMMWAKCLIAIGLVAVAAAVVLMR